MRSRRIVRRAGLWTIMAGFVAASLAAQPSRAFQETSFSDVHWRAEQAGTRAWTAEEMSSAVAADLPAVSEADLAAWAADAYSVQPDTAGGTGSLPGGLPAGEQRAGRTNRAALRGA